MTTPSLTNPNPKREDEREASANEVIGYLNVYRDDDGDLVTGSSDLCATAEEASDFRASEFEDYIGVFALVPAASARPSPGDPVRAALEEAVQAFNLVRGIIVDAAMTGFNCADGDWAERLFYSQADTSHALKTARAALAHPQQGGERDEEAAKWAERIRNSIRASKKDRVQYHHMELVQLLAVLDRAAPTSSSKSSGEEA